MSSQHLIDWVKTGHLKVSKRMAGDLVFDMLDRRRAKRDFGPSEVELLTLLEERFPEEYATIMGQEDWS
jgi:hypothetical protein